ncbi:MAG: phage tail tape measure protein, partial [Clostridiales bacterium]|nr:phage tail tape measure protein [Clostridiales bacterium]
SAEKMVAALSSAGMHGALNTFLSTFAAADRSLIGINSKIAEMQRVLSQSIKFNLAMRVQNFVIGQVQGAIGWARDLNEALTDIAIVAPEVAGKMDVVAETIIRGAQELRVAAKSYAEAAIIFYQQGLSMEDVDRRTRITIKAAKVAGASVKDMSEQLTAVWNTYQMQDDELERAASVAAKLGAETAAAFEDISEAMKVAASGASMLGVSYESLVSIVTTVRESTLQSASTIANAYKTIFARFTNLKTSGEDAGESLGRISQSLADLGVNVLDQAGQLRDLDEVIMQLGTTWDIYSRKQQIAIAQVVGGTRQYQQFLALMQNFDKYQRNLASAESETGTEELDRQYMESLKSVDTAMENSAETWRRAFANLFASDAQIGFYKSIEKIGSAFEGVIESVGGLKGVLIVVGSLMASQIAPTVEKIGIGIKEWKDNLTIGTQQAAAQRDSELMRKSLSRLGRETGIDISGDAQKVEMTQKASAANIILNRLIKEGNADTKIRAEYLKNQVELSQSLGMAALDELAVLEKSAAQQSERFRREAEFQERKSEDQLDLDSLDDLNEARLALFQEQLKFQQLIEAEIVAASESGDAAAAASAAQERVNAAERELVVLQQCNIARQNAGEILGQTERDALAAAQQEVDTAKRELDAARQVAQVSRDQAKEASRVARIQEEIVEFSNKAVSVQSAGTEEEKQRAAALKISAALLETMAVSSEA